MRVDLSASGLLFKDTQYPVCVCIEWKPSPRVIRRAERWDSSLAVN